MHKPIASRGKALYAGPMFAVNDRTTALPGCTLPEPAYLLVGEDLLLSPQIVAALPEGPP